MISEKKFVFLKRLGLVLSLSALTSFAVEVSPPAKPEGKAPEKTEAKSDYSPAELRFWEAIKLLEKTTLPEQEKGIAQLKNLADEEIPMAQTYLGYLYISGHSALKKNPRKAVSLFRLAAERGDGFAMVSYAQAKLQGTGTWKDRDEAKKWFEAAIAAPNAFKANRPPPSYFADKEDAPLVSGTVEVDQTKKTIALAHYFLAQILRDLGKLPEAHSHFVAAAEADGTYFGPFEATIEAALDFAFAKGTSRDMDKANRMIELSKQQLKRSTMQLIHNFASAKIIDEFAMGEVEDSTDKTVEDSSGQLQAGIGADFLDKKNKLYDPAAAEKWFLLGAEAGNKSAQYNLALHYAKGDFGAVNNEAAFKWFEKVSATYTRANANYAIALQNGLGVARDTQKAQALFKKHVSDDIVFYLGSIGKCPDKFISHQESFVLTTIWAKEKEDGHAQALLGECYAHGYGVERDYDDARKWYKRAAKKQDAFGLYRFAGLELSSLREDEHKAAQPFLEMLKKSAALGNSEACTDFGYYANRGKYMDRNPEIAKEYFQKAIALDPEDFLAMNNLAVVYFNAYEKSAASGEQTNADKELKQAVEWWHRAEKQPLANYNLGELYYSGGDDLHTSEFKKDDAKAYNYFLAAAEGGHIRARRVVAEMHLKGLGVPRTPTEAAYHFRLAALDGDVEALERLIFMYMSGQGVSKDFDRAFMWINMLANKGRYSALVLATDALLNKKEYKAAIEYLEFLEDHGNEYVVGFASYRFYMVYGNGWGVKVNPEKAKRYYEKALKNNSSHAFLDEGRKLAQAKKYPEAIEMLKKVNGVLPEALTMLGEFYLKGQGVPKDPQKALTYFKTAAQENDPYGLFWHAYTTAINIPGAPSLTEAIEEAKQALKFGVIPAKNLIANLEATQKSGATVRPEPGSDE